MCNQVEGKKVTGTEPDLRPNYFELFSNNCPQLQTNTVHPNNKASKCQGADNLQSLDGHGLKEGLTLTKHYVQRGLRWTVVHCAMRYQNTAIGSTNRTVLRGRSDISTEATGAARP